MGIYLSFHKGTPDGWREGARDWCGRMWEAWVETSRLVAADLPAADDPRWNESAWLERLHATILEIWMLDIRWEDFALAEVPDPACLRVARDLRAGGDGAWRTDDPSAAATVDRLTYLLMRCATYHVRYRSNDLFTAWLLANEVRGPPTLAEDLSDCVKWVRYPRARYLFGLSPEAQQLWGFLDTGRSLREGGGEPFLVPKEHDDSTFGWFSLPDCSLLLEELSRLPELPEDDDGLRPRLAVETVLSVAQAAVEGGTGVFFTAG